MSVTSDTNGSNTLHKRALLLPAENSSGQWVCSRRDVTQMPSRDHLHLSPGTNRLLSPVPTSHASVGKAGIPTAPGNWQPLQYSFYWNDPSFEAMITNLLLASVSRRSSLALTCLIEDYSDISISNASIDTATYTGLCFSSQTVTKHGTEPDQTDTTFCLMSTFFISLITE